MSGSNRGASFANDFWLGTEKKWMETFIGTHWQKPLQQIDTGNPLFDRKAEQTCGPKNTHPVDPDHIAILHISGKHRIGSHID
jgi:hypothetical protein